MSSSRRETAAARAALARRRQRGIFTPSPTNAAAAASNAASFPSSSSQTKSLPINSSSKTKGETPPLSASVAPRQVTNRSSTEKPLSSYAKMRSSPQKANARRPALQSSPTRQPKVVTAVKSNGNTESPVRTNGADRAVRFTSNNDKPFLANHAENNKQVEEEEPSVVEEPEPITTDQVLDAKCLKYDSSIVIRSQSNARSLLSITKRTRGDAARYLATMTGTSIAGDNHVFELKQATQDASNGNDVARYGTVVSLQSNAAQDRALGVRKLSATEGTTYEVGFFRSTISAAEQWTILHGNRVVLVGSAAVSNDNGVKKRGKTAAVRSGDPILLRNVLTGGLLALDSIDDSLTLVTDSYDSDTVRTGSLSDKDPLSKIQHHDRILPSARETFQFVNSQVPPCPQWADEEDRRMYESGSYLLHSGRNDRNEETNLALFGPPLRDGRKSLQTPLKQGVGTQERILLDEVIGSLVGLEGSYVKLITNSNVPPHFGIVEPAGVTFDASLKNLVNRILPFSTAFVRVQAFMSLHRPGYEYGFVVQAVCEAFDELLQEHLAFVAEMEQLLRQDDEDDPMTISKLNVFVQSALRKIALLEHTMPFVQEQKGGTLLNTLHELKTRVFAGDGIAQEVLELILRKGSAPYFKMLDAWLQSGVIDDPFSEFMIETSDCSNAVRGYDGDTWNQMFQIRKEHVLDFVISSPVVQQQVLLTGKYWNAVQLCKRTTLGLQGRDYSDQCEQNGLHVKYGMDSVSLSSTIHSMYRSASRQLLELLMRDFGAMETLLTLKRYFLLHQGDFLVHFFDAAEDELSHELEHVSRGRVNQWLNMCVQLTEPDLDDSLSSVSLMGGTKPAGPLQAQMLRCSFAPDSLMDHLDAMHAENGGIDAHEPKTPSRHPYGMVNKGMTGIEAFAIHFDRIPFPTSLLISQHALSTYQLLFRHLFFCKYVERRLVGIWLDHQMMKQFQSPRRAMGPTYSLRQRMLHFMQNLIYFMMFEVIEPNWLEMESAIRKGQSEGRIQTVDDVIQVHNRFLDLALAECLLTNRDLARTLTKVMRTCLLFSDQLKRFMEATKIADENKTVAKEKRSTIQRNLNDPANTRRAPSKKAIRKAMLTQNEQRAIRMQKQAARVERELANESYKRMISRYDEVFSENLADFMKQLLSASNEEHHSQKANLCIRLDYNGYVTRQMGLH